jgi:hypothetical protein
MGGEWNIPAEISDITINKCPHILCFVDYEHRPAPKNGRTRKQLFLLFINDVKAVQCTVQKHQ